MGLMDTLHRISQQYGEGLAMEKLGPDWRQKRALLEAQTENVGAETERSRAATGHERAATEQAQFALQEAKAKRDEIKRLVDAGMLPSTDLAVADYYVRKADADARAAGYESERKLREAQTGEVVSRTLTPEQKAEQFRASMRESGTRAAANTALANYREAREEPEPKSQLRTIPPTQQDEYLKQAVKNVNARRPDFWAKARNLGAQLSGEVLPLPKMATEGSPEYAAEVQKEYEKLVSQGSYEIVSDPATKQTMIRFPGGSTAPITQPQAFGLPPVPDQFVGPPLPGDEEPYRRGGHLGSE